MSAAGLYLLTQACQHEPLPPTLIEWGIWQGFAESSPWLDPANRVPINADGSITIHADAPYSARAIVSTPAIDAARCIYNLFRINWSPSRSFECYPEAGARLTIERNIPSGRSEFRGRPASGVSRLKIEVEERSSDASSSQVFVDYVVADLPVVVPECPCP
jgi:hypothetical protein